jgi:hypothetical protein
MGQERGTGPAPKTRHAGRGQTDTRLGSGTELVSRRKMHLSTPLRLDSGDAPGWTLVTRLACFNWTLATRTNS